MGTEPTRSPAHGMIDQLGDLIGRFEVRDLTHMLEEGIPFFPTHTRFHQMDVGRSDDPAIMFQILMHEHNGTHVDAPAHYIAEGPDPERHFMQSVRPDSLIGPAAILDVSETQESLLSLNAVRAWEDSYGPVRRNEIVIFNFGWHRKWKLWADGADFVENWPGLHRDVALYLLERGVRAVGTDCLGLDAHGSTEIPAHHHLLRNDILIMENLAALDGLPQRVFFLAAPLRIRRGSGSPIRALALIPKEE